MSKNSVPFYFIGVMLALVAVSVIYLGYNVSKVGNTITIDVQTQR